LDEVVDERHLPRKYSDLIIEATGDASGLHARAKKNLPLAKLGIEVTPRTPISPSPKTFLKNSSSRSSSSRPL